MVPSSTLEKTTGTLTLRSGAAGEPSAIQPPNHAPQEHVPPVSDKLIGGRPVWSASSESGHPPIGRARASRKKSEKAKALARLNPTQRAVVEDIARRSKEAHEEAVGRLEREVRHQRYSPRDVQLGLKALRDELPLHIHFQPEDEFREGRSVISLLDTFIRDGRYKSVWETKRSNGNPDLSTRARAERRLYYKMYPEPGVPEERPVHGLVNTVDGLDPSALQYGDAILVLKPEVKHRASLTAGDSFHAAMNDRRPASFEHPAAGLIDYIHNVYGPVHFVDRAIGRTPDPAQQVMREYIDVAVHGPLEFAKDIAELRMPARLRGTAHERAAQRFSEKFGVPLTWTDGFTTDPRPASGSWGGPPPTPQELANMKRLKREEEQKEAQAKLDQGALLLDVRDEADQQPSPKGAVRIPIEELEAKLSELGAPSAAVIVSGSIARSQLAAELLGERGVTDTLALGHVPPLWLGRAGDEKG